MTLERFWEGKHETRFRWATLYISLSFLILCCILGQRFAMLEMKVALCGILREFILVPIDKPEDIVFKADLVLRPQNDLRVKFVLRQ